MIEKHFADVIIIGNGSAAAAAVYELNRYLKDEEEPLKVIVLDALSEEEERLRIPEYNMRVSFPYDFAEPLPEAEDAVVQWYDKVAFYSPRRKLIKNLPPQRVALCDIDKLIHLMEKNLSPSILIKRHHQVFDARYVDTDRGELIRLSTQYPFGPGKVFEPTGEFFARAVIDASGTGSVLLDKMQGYRQDSDVVCGVLAFKVVGAKLPDLGEVSLGLDDRISHGAGAWAYHNGNTITPELKGYLKRWLETTENPRVKRRFSGVSVEELAGTISDVGISSMSTYANAQHYKENLERQVEDLFTNFGAYRDFFEDSVVVPGSAFFKPSPVLQPVEKMGGRRYLLAGDAAGHATPYIGEGVRPGVDMGRAAARILIGALKDGDLSSERLCEAYEARWWEIYGEFDIYSDLFRHFSSTCFNDREWDLFFEGIQNKLSDEEFFEVLKSQYTFDIVLKMFRWRFVTRYAKHRMKSLGDFLLRRTTPRQVASWLE